MTEAGRKLRQLIETHGRSLWEDPRRVQRLLSELVPTQTREVNVLAAAPA